VRPRRDLHPRDFYSRLQLLANAAIAARAARTRQLGRGSRCDGYHKMFDLGAMGERVHKGAARVEPWCRARRLDGPFAGLMEATNEQDQ
jgi:hypothetical protein